MKIKNQMPASKDKSKARKGPFCARIIGASLLATVFAAPVLAQQINLPRSPLNPTSTQECQDLNNAYSAVLKEINAEASRGREIWGEGARTPFGEGRHELMSEGNRIEKAANDLWRQVAAQSRAAHENCHSQVRAHRDQVAAERNRNDQTERQRRDAGQQSEHQAEMPWSSPFTMGQMPTWGQGQAQTEPASKFERTVAGIEFGMTLFNAIINAGKSSSYDDDDTYQDSGSTYSSPYDAATDAAEEAAESLMDMSVGAALDVSMAALNPFTGENRGEHVLDTADDALDNIKLESTIGVDSFILNSALVYTTGLGKPAESSFLDAVDTHGSSFLDLTSPLTSPISRVALGGVTTIERQVLGELERNVIQPMNDLTVAGVAAETGELSRSAYRPATTLPVGDFNPFGDAINQRPGTLPMTEPGEILYRDPLSRTLETALPLADGVQFGDYIDASGRVVCSANGLGVVIASCELSRTR